MYVIHVHGDFILPSPPLFFSDYVNGAQFFQNDPHTDWDTAAGGVYIIMGFLSLVRVPVLIVAIVMVSNTCAKMKIIIA